MDKNELKKICERTLRQLIQEPVQLKPQTRKPPGMEAAYRLSGGGIEARVGVYVRSRFRPAEVAQLATRVPSTSCDHRMLFTEYVAPALAERLQQSKIWFADAQGNAFVSIPPKLLLNVSGKRPARIAAPKGQHFSAPGAKALHYLLKHGPRVRATYRDIREAVGVSIDKIGKLIRELEGEGTLRVHGRGDYEILNGDRLLRLWVDAFDARLLPELLIGRFAVGGEPDFEHLVREAVDELKADLVVGGELAADVLTSHLRPATLRLYIPPQRASNVRRQLRLAPSERGTVELLRLYSTDIASERDAFGAAVADPAFVYGELMAGGDDRLAETALRLRQDYLSWTL